MHYVFKSKADADLLMMAPIADHLLQIIGREPAAQGIVENRAIPSAVAAIEAAIAAEERVLGHGGDDDQDASRGNGRVTLRQRAWPMLEMMKRSIAEHADIVWGV